MFSQVNDVAHGPLVFVLFFIWITSILAWFLWSEFEKKHALYLHIIELIAWLNYKLVDKNWTSVKKSVIDHRHGTREPNRECGRLIHIIQRAYILARMATLGQNNLKFHGCMSFISRSLICSFLSYMKLGSMILNIWYCSSHMVKLMQILLL